MNINDFVTANSASNYLGLNSSSRAATGVSATGQNSLARAEKRIQSQVDVTTAQLSSLGKLKSAVSGTQIAAQALGKLSATSTNAGAKTAAESFVTAFNSAIGTAKTASEATGEPSSSLSASRVGRDLVRTVSADTSTRDALKKIGFNLTSDGKLTLDASKFAAAQTGDAAAVNATLAKIGQQVDQTATRELASTGNVGTAVTSLNQRASVLKNQQSALATLQQTTPGAADNSAYSNAFSGFGNLGLSAYKNY
ncbi:MAG TPA: hypothetical protein PLB25_01660 [Rhodoferax sp.]|nr:hypothetical protein [Rhodoferax sp.]